MSIPPYTVQQRHDSIMARITKSPEWLQLANGTGLDHTHRTARAFSVIDDRCVLSGWCTHPTIFNAIRRRIADPGFSLEEYEVTAWPEITSADLSWFNHHWTGVLGVMRERTLSGRIWQGVQVEGREVSVVSFWVDQKKVPASVVDLVIKGLALPSPVYVDYMDSNESLEWSHSPAEVNQKKADSI